MNNLHMIKKSMAIMFTLVVLVSVVAPVMAWCRRRDVGTLPSM